MNVIKTMSDYHKYLSSFQRIDLHNKGVSSFTLFRGQANCDWKLSPRVYREGLFEYEGLLLTELLHICPSEFTDNRFETLTKMQHFGLPTRLLDVTTNPLIALYFACSDDKQVDKDGSVHVFPNCPVSWSTDPLVELVMDYIFDYYGPTKIWLEELLNACMAKYQQAVGRIMPDSIESLLHYMLIPAFSIMPKKNNARIIAQDGAFFMFGMVCTGKETSTNPGTLGREYYSFSPYEADSENKIWRLHEKVIIPGECKKELLTQLETIGINGYKLFPDLSHQTNYVVDLVKRQTRV